MIWKKLLVGTWSWKRPFYSLAFVYTCMAIFAVGFGDRLIFMPPAAGYSEKHPQLEKALAPSGNEIVFIHLRAQAGMPTILYSHGNAEDISGSMEIYQAWRAGGIGVVAYDYPGYGRSTGTPNEKSCEEAIQTIWNYLLAEKIQPASIVIVGRSVGSGPSTWLAVKENPGGLALIAPFTSTYRVAIPLPFPIFPGDRFPNKTRIREYNGPLLIIHGTKDEVIPYKHGLELMEASPSKEKTHHPIPGAGHNDLFLVAGQEIVDLVEAFAKKNQKD
jgi:abhydrolase domain-containing protein 17